MSRAQRRFRHVVDFLDHCNTNFKKSKSSSECCEWDNTVTIKLDASDNDNSDKEYRKKFGVNFMDEDTLIIGDDMNNVLMVYQDENKVAAEDITSLIHVINRLCLTPQCIIHKRVEPSKTPPHIKISLNFVQNNIQNANNIQNNFANLHVSSTINQSAIGLGSAQCYLETYFKRGGTCPLKRISRHPEWEPAYKGEIETKKMDICKFCEKRWLKGCCANYSRTNRTIWVMVIGWHE